MQIVNVTLTLGLALDIRNEKKPAKQWLKDHTRKSKGKHKLQLLCLHYKNDSSNKMNLMICEFVKTVSDVLLLMTLLYMLTQMLRLTTYN